MGLVLTLRLVWIASPLFLAAFLGVLFGLAVEGGVDRLQRLRIPRGLGAFLIVFAFYGALVGLGAWMAPTLREQGAELRTRLPQAIDRVEEWLNDRPGFIGLVLRGTSAPATPAARDTTADTSSAARAAEAVREAQREAQRDTASGALPGGGETPTETLRERVAASLSGVGRYLFPFITSTFAILGGLLLITVIAIYIGADPETYHRGLLHLFPHGSRKRAGEVLSAMATVLRKWLVTQLIAMAAIGTVTTAVLLFLDVKAAFALGIIAGLLEFIPTIGPILSALPAVAMGFLDSPEKALWVAVAYVIIQQLENHVLIPKLMEGGLDIPPVLTIMAQALMAIVFGFLGLLVAVPMLAAVMVPIKLLYVQDVIGDPVSVFDEEDDD